MKKKYAVTFIQEYVYHVEVDAEDEDDFAADVFEERAIDQAYEKFERDMRYPVARVDYDDYEVEEE